ncbi:5-methyltetrahydropteroyltriglutamate--homocysteine S-methyltransferase [Eupransor demetentiae]|uniref:Methionine synthase II (Cobalamin-independent) (MetE) n=1 Tax=Eupransor demetentiae TaxID=3109584 RepID=A0ABP0EQ98_9LACO|nr:Methionine synthase II (cobalamin-independent) (MetE) [Lactobacillaceae bacterium LMG 33000]
MPKFHNENIHYDIVGSFLRPERLKRAQQAFDDGQSHKTELQQIQDEEIQDLVKKEVAAGLKFVSDGEFRRSWWHLDTFWGFKGIKKIFVKEGYQFHGVETRKESAQVDGKIAFNPKHPDLEAFQFLYQVTKDLDVVPRQSIPSPAQCYAELVRGEDNIKALNQYYEKQEDLFDDLTKAYHDLILALYDAGCRDIKLDDCTWGMLADKNFWKTMSADAGDIQKLKDLYLDLNNRAIADLPDDLRISTHVCRGNYASTWAASGGYGPVANDLFGKEKVDAFYLEFDTPRSGNFGPLKEVPAGKEVVLGLVTSKEPKLEKPEEIAKRVKEASEYVDFNNLSLSTQCGFASTDEGNHLTEEQQWAKIKLVVDTAKQIWSK